MCNSTEAALVNLFFDESGDVQKQNGSYEGSYQGSDESTVRTDAQQAEYPATDDSANDAQNDVHKKAKTASLHDFTGSPSCDGSDDNEVKKSHFSKI